MLPSCWDEPLGCPGLLWARLRPREADLALATLTYSSLSPPQPSSNNPSEARQARANITNRHKNGLQDVVWDLLWTARQKPVLQLLKAVRDQIAASPELCHQYTALLGMGSWHGNIFIKNMNTRSLEFYPAWLHFVNGVPQPGTELN